MKCRCGSYNVIESLGSCLACLEEINPKALTYVDPKIAADAKRLRKIRMMGETYGASQQKIKEMMETPRRSALMEKPPKFHTYKEVFDYLNDDLVKNGWQPRESRSVVVNGPLKRVEFSGVMTVSGPEVIESKIMSLLDDAKKSPEDWKLYNYKVAEHSPTYHCCDLGEKGVDHIHQKVPYDVSKDIDEKTPRTAKAIGQSLIDKWAREKAEAQALEATKEAAKTFPREQLCHSLTKDQVLSCMSFPAKEKDILHFEKDYPDVREWVKENEAGLDGLVKNLVGPEDGPYEGENKLYELGRKKFVHGDVGMFQPYNPRPIGAQHVPYFSEEALRELDKQMINDAFREMGLTINDSDGEKT